MSVALKKPHFFTENRDNLVLENTGFFSHLTSNVTCQDSHWLHPTPQPFFSNSKLSSPYLPAPSVVAVLWVKFPLYEQSLTYIWFLHSPTPFLHRLVPHRLQAQNVLSNLSPNLLLGTDQVLQWNDQLITWVLHLSTDIPLNTLPVSSKAIKLNISFQNSVRQWFETLTGRPLQPKYNINVAGYGSLCF